MSEQATLTGGVANGPSVGFGVFVAGLAGAFLAGALVVGLLAAQVGATATAPAAFGQVGTGVTPGLTDVPTPASVPPLRRPPGAEYRRIPDDGTGSGFVTRAPSVIAGAVGHPGDEDRRIPDDSGAG